MVAVYDFTLAGKEIYGFDDVCALYGRMKALRPTKRSYTLYALAESSKAPKGRMDIASERVKTSGSLERERRQGMGVSIAEQETSINIMRDSEYAEIYTSDSTMMTKYDKFARKPGLPGLDMHGIIRDREGNLVAKTYRTKKWLISARSVIVKRELTEEQRQEAAERLRAVRNKTEQEDV